MKSKMVIIANRRKGSDYWEGYIERPKAEADSWVGYYRSIGNVVKVFPSMNEYRADCNKLLDKIIKPKALPRTKRDGAFFI